MKKTSKPPTPAQEIRQLKARIAEAVDAHKSLLRKETTPLRKRLQVLLAAQALARAERALVKSVQSDPSPQLDLLGNLPAPGAEAGPEQASLLMQPVR